MLRLFFDGDGFAILIELNDTESLRVVHIVAEDGCALAGFGIFYRLLQAFFQTRAR